MANIPIPTADELSRKYNAPLVQQTQEKKPVTKIAANPVTVKKKSFGKKFAELFFSSDIQDIQTYVLEVAVIPTIKNTICNILHDIPELLFWGKTSRTGTYSAPWQDPRQTTFRYDRVALNSTQRTDMYGRPTQTPPQQQPQRNYMFDDIILRTATEAEALRTQMLDRIELYGAVTVAEVNEMLNVQNNNFTNYDWGWKNIASCEIRQVRGGYLVSLPPCTYLK